MKSTRIRESIDRGTAARAVSALVRRRLRCGWGIVVLAMLFAPLFGQMSLQDKKGDDEKKETTEYDLKAGLIEQFMKFVDFPESVLAKDAKEITLGVLGPDPFGKSLDATAGKTIRGRKIVVKRYDKLDDVKEKECHVLFVAANHAKKLADVTSTLEKKSILVIGETTTSVDSGAAFGLVIKDKKVAFEVNLDAAKKAAISISSKLVKLAARVVKAKDN